VTPERYEALQYGSADRLTPEETQAGWHWCLEMDGLLCLRGSADCFCESRNPDDHKPDLCSFDFSDLLEPNQ
jgi:hypothetical protein